MIDTNLRGNDDPVELCHWPTCVEAAPWCKHHVASREFAQGSASDRPFVEVAHHDCRARFRAIADMREHGADLMTPTDTR